MLKTQIKPKMIDLGEIVYEPAINQPILFLDDQFIADQTGLIRQPGTPVKWAGNPIFKPQRPWEGQCTIIWGSVICDPTDGLFKMWYEAYNPLDPPPCHRICYATSKDGIDWDRPSLNIVEWNGSRDNNIVLVGDDTIDSATVSLDPFAPREDQRLKMMLYDHAHRALVRFGSADGIRWRKLGPVKLTRPVGDRHSMCADAEQGKWLIYHRAANQSRTIYLSTSDDFEHWKEHGEVLRPSENDPPETELYGMIGFRDQGVRLGFLEMFHVLERRLDTQLVRLDDQGRPTRYMPNRPFLPRGEWGEWDSTWVCPGNCAPVRVGEELRIYYQGRRTLHWADPPNGNGHIGAIGVARLRPHGWAYMTPVDDARGILTTVPLRVVGQCLCINADARGGEVRAELLNEQGKPIDGFSAADCYPLTSDATFFRFAFSGSSRLDSLHGRPVRVRLYLNGAKVYSLWFHVGS